MKKLFLLICTVCFAMAIYAQKIWDGTIDTQWYDSNKYAREYTLYTAEQLAGFAKLNNENNINFHGKTVRLGADIFLNDTTGWQNWNENTTELNKWIPIGKGYEPFYGTFDGEGYTVYGGYINSTEKDQGLFGDIYYAAIYNTNIDASYIKGEYGVGLLSGSLSFSEIINCFARGNVMSQTDLSTCAGCLIGSSSRACIINSGACGNIKTINTSIYETSTGIVVGGMSDTDIINCYGYGNIITTGKEVYTGAIAGYTGATTKNVNIKNCYGFCTITYTDESPTAYLASFIGRLGLYCILTDCYYNSEASELEIIGKNYNPDPVEVTGLTTEQMKSAAFLSQLNENVTAMNQEESDYVYPYLYWKADTNNENRGYPSLKNRYGYTVEHYYNTVKNNNATESGAILIGKKTGYTPKLKGNFRLDYTNPQEGEITISQDEAINLLQVYYKDIVGYKIEYYYDGQPDAGNTVSSELSIGNSLQWSEQQMGKPKEKYVFDYTDPASGILVISENAEENVLKVYYKKDVSTGLHAKENVSIFPYPNPATNYISIKGLTEDTEAVLYDTNGRKVRIQTISPGQQIDCTGLSEGVYLLSIHGKIQKLVIKRN